MRKRIGMVLLLVGMLLLTACVREEPLFGDRPAPGQPTLMQESSGKVHFPEPPTEPPTEPEVTEPVITAPETLRTMLAANGTTVQELTQLGCKQLVTVAAEGAAARIELYILENDQWIRQETLSCSGYVGMNGTKAYKREGDGCSPRGLYPITQAFYMYEAPRTGLPMFEITPETYWVDDPTSVYYNKRVEGTDHKDWDSAEHMIRYGAAYEYGFVVGYNPDGAPYAGSAIFFHVSDHPTSGCIGTDRSFVLQYLAALDGSRNPYILLR